jgi:hypothetical protein
MSKGLLTTLVIHSCPLALQPESESKLKELGLELNWGNQSLVVGTSFAEGSFRCSQVELDEIASKLAQAGSLHFELVQHTKHSGVIYMFVPGLGLYRGELNASGSLVVTDDKLQTLLDQSAGNHREFTRLLRLCLGQSWDDILEPFRAAKYSDNVLLLNRAG